ncbi:MAG: hypothetical protein M1817_002106 [Caeruleum heppii]|nr:MAG: hypothetical protein M1817_002106 [Caeruleum heppii]
MSYPPPPGLKPLSSTASSSATPPNASLPPRPVSSAAPLPSFKPSFGPASSSTAGAPGTGSYGATAAAAFKPRQVNTAWQTSSSAVTGPSISSYSNTSYDSNQSSQPSYYPASGLDAYNTDTPPQIRNPFPLPGQGYGAGSGRGGAGGRFDEALDPEMEAQIAQWQSAYAGKDAADQSSSRSGARFGGRSGGSTVEGAGSASGANAGPLGGRHESGAAAMTSAAVASAADGDTGVASIVSGSDGKQKTVVRSGGGQSWTDSSLLEWDPAHFRLFVGNLAGEVTDESLLKAFARYPSVQKARVVRDKRTTKSKGYGFVSFSDGEEYFAAAREMQGRYIGSHPVLLRRSTTEIRPVTSGDRKGGKYGKKGKNGSNHGSGIQNGAGVQKKSSKTKGGLRVLG